MQRALLAFLLLFPLAMASAQDIVEWKQGDRVRSVHGKVLVEAADGGLLTLGSDGRIWPVPGEQVIRHAVDGARFEPLTAEQLARELLNEMGPQFDVWQTKHYVICYNTNREFARWCGQLFERLYKAFTNYWSRHGFPIREPEFPLPVLVFADPGSYSGYAAAELNADPEQVPGFYSFHTNRVSLLDLTALAAAKHNVGSSGRFRRRLQRFLATPAGQMTVATVVHEATHQIAFNCGLQTRYADNPLWLSEGMAIVFEAPDLKSRTGWSGIGTVNYRRLREFRNYTARRRTGDSLRSLVSSDERLRRLDTGPDAYAEAWALNYFLLQTRRNDYHRYLQVLNAKPRLIFDSAETRLAEFEKVFGDVAELEVDFVRYMEKVR
jgi:hypothetical protein